MPTGDDSYEDNSPQKSQNVAVSLGGGTSVAANKVDLNHIHTHALSHQQVGPSEIDSAALDFVAPENYQEIKRHLLENNLVVLNAKRGQGRHTGALRLVLDVQNEMRNSAPIRDVWRLKPSGLEPQLTTIPRIKGHIFVLDLSDNTDRLDDGTDLHPKESFGSGLKDYANLLKVDNSFLIIVVTPQAWEYCREVSDEDTFSWRPPSARTIITERLKGSLKSHERISWLGDQRFDDILSRSSLLPPAEAVRLARSIARAKDNTSEQMDAKSVALDEFKHWSGHLRRWFRNHPNVFDRAVIIAAAALGKSRAQDVVDAADSLLRLVGQPSSEENPLSAPDLIEQLANTGAEIGDDDSVNLNEYRPEFDQSVIEHVWKQRPKTREHLETWLLQQATGVHATEDQRKRIASVMVRLASSRDAGVYLVNFLTKFAGEGKKHHDLAVDLLDGAVLDPVLGPYVRGRLLGWASSKTALLLGLTAAACGKRLGHERTDLALNRLAKVLANPSSSQDVLEITGQALNKISFERERRLKVVRSLSHLLQTSPRAGAKAFLRLVYFTSGSVVPSLLEDSRNDVSIRFILIDCWKSACTAVGAQECAESMRSWFSSIGSALPEDMVLEICLPALRADSDKSLAASVFEGNSNRRVLQIVMREIVSARTSLREE
ncbi:hypothetical protein AB0I53_19590 [Saccharopolyspora sp. NPDC050389]|uniref:hypothetical protein n=1 Tax=Saccharopolyspora sp. NPDC050389 TaxID=3155516 RepID=UPI0033E67B41